MEQSEPAANSDEIRTALGKLREPELKRTVADLNLLKNVEVDDKRVFVALDLVTSDASALQSLREQAPRGADATFGQASDRAFNWAGRHRHRWRARCGSRSCLWAPGREA